MSTKENRESVSGSIFLTQMQGDVAVVKRVVLGEAFDDGTVINLKRRHTISGLADRVVEDVEDEYKELAYEKVTKSIGKILSGAEHGEEVTVSLTFTDYLNPKVVDVVAETVAAE